MQLDQETRLFFNLPNEEYDRMELMDFIEDQLFDVKKTIYQQPLLPVLYEKKIKTLEHLQRFQQRYLCIKAAEEFSATPELDGNVELLSTFWEIGKHLKLYNENRADLQIKLHQASTPDELLHAVKEITELDWNFYLTSGKSLKLLLPQKDLDIKMTTIIDWQVVQNGLLKTDVSPLENEALLPYLYQLVKTAEFIEQKYLI